MIWCSRCPAQPSQPAGADGLIIEAHNDPAHALCDGAQSLDLNQFDTVMKDIKRRAEFEGRVMMP